MRSPELWGIDHPNLYRSTAEVRDAQGHIWDQQSDSFGICTIEIRDRHLLLNGERVRLIGVARHEDSVSEGLAETTGTMRYDWHDMKSLPVALTRPVHYPHKPFILDYADRHGIHLIPEIPVWQFSEAQLRNPRVIARAKQQLREMIEESGNHPSIFAWSVCNESDTGTPGGIAYFRAMRDYIRQLDPIRYVTYADDKLPKLKRAEDSVANDARATEALRFQNVQFGQLMFRFHANLRDDYEVSCKELELLVDLRRSLRRSHDGRRLWRMHCESGPQRSDCGFRCIYQVRVDHLDECAAD